MSKQTLRLGMAAMLAMACLVTACGSKSSGGGAGTGAAGGGSNAAKADATQCATACTKQQGCGESNGDCMTQCAGLSATCATCLGSKCFLECQTECSDGAQSGSTAGTGAAAGDGSGEAGTGTAEAGTGGSSTQCSTDAECGISFKCVGCTLNGGAGFCLQENTETKTCTFDADCGADGKCGYHVESGNYMCLPKAKCP